MEIKNKTAILISLLFLFGGILMMVLSFTGCKERITPEEYCIIIRRNDSIDIVKSTKLMRYHVLRSFKKRKVIGDVVKCTYDNDSCYFKTEYWYVNENDTNNTLQYIKSRITYSRLEFIYNNGNYIVKPKIIKTLKPSTISIPSEHEVEYAIEKLKKIE